MQYEGGTDNQSEENKRGSVGFMGLKGGEGNEKESILRVVHRVRSSCCQKKGVGGASKKRSSLFGTSKVWRGKTKIQNPCRDVGPCN